MWIDEFAFMPYNQITYDAASPAQSKAKEMALLNNMPAFKALTTTPSDLDTPEGVFCKSMMDAAAPFKEELYDMTRDQIDEYIDNHSSNNFVYIEFSYKELGRDKKWFKTQCRELNNNKIKIKRELLLEWTRTSDNSWLDEETADVLNDGIVASKSIKLGFKSFYLDVVKPFNPLKPYMISVDVAGGLGRDSSSITIQEISDVNPKDCIIGTFTSNSIDTDDLYYLICHMMDMIFPNSCYAIERNSYGLTIIQRLMKSTSYSQKLFATYKSKKAERAIKSARTRTKGETETLVYGIDTNKTSREMMFELLDNELQNNPEKFTPKQLVKELTTLAYSKAGKIEHLIGCHDDMVMSFNIGNYAKTFKRELRKWSSMVDASETIDQFKNPVTSTSVSTHYIIGLNQNLPEKSKYMGTQTPPNPDASSDTNNFLNILNLN